MQRTSCKDITQKHHSTTSCKHLTQAPHACTSCKHIMQALHASTSCKNSISPGHSNRQGVCRGVVQVLTSLSTAQQNKSDAGRRRWDRNVAVEGPKRLTHAEAFAQRAHRSPHGAWQGAKSELHDGPLVSTQCSQSLGIPPLPTDTVLTFTVHRFDRSASCVLW